MRQIWDSYLATNYKIFAVHIIWKHRVEKLGIYYQDNEPKIHGIIWRILFSKCLISIKNDLKEVLLNNGKAKSQLLPMACKLQIWQLEKLKKLWMCHYWICMANREEKIKKKHPWITYSEVFLSKSVILDSCLTLLTKCLNIDYASLLLW